GPPPVATPPAAHVTAADDGDDEDLAAVRVPSPPSHSGDLDDDEPYGDFAATVEELAPVPLDEDDLDNADDADDARAVHDARDAHAAENDALDAFDDRPSILEADVDDAVFADNPSGADDDDL